MTVLDAISIIHHSASAGQTAFDGPQNSQIFINTDVKVYLTPNGQDYDDALDLLTLYTDYTVTILANGFSITLVVAASANDEITIKRALPYNRPDDWGIGGVFTGTSMDINLDRITIQGEQNRTRVEERGLTYPDTAVLGTADNTFPKLGAGQFVKENSTGNGLIAVTLEENPDWSTLRSELANNMAGTDGSRMIGYNDTTAGPTTVHERIDSIYQLVISAIGYNYISGFKTENSSVDLGHDIKIFDGACSDSTNSVPIKLTSVIIKQIDANWVEGSDQGGFPSGITLSANTTYHLYVIKKADGAVDAGFDSALDASNLLADATDYIYYRRIASVMTDSSSNIIRYHQFADKFYLYTPVFNGLTVMTGLEQTIVLAVPTGINVNALINYRFTITTTGSAHLYIRPIYIADMVPASTAAPLSTAHSHDLVGSGSVSKYDFMEILTNSTSLIRARSDSNQCELRVVTIGWRDERGKI